MKKLYLQVHVSFVDGGMSDSFTVVIDIPSYGGCVSYRRLSVQFCSFI